MKYISNLITYLVISFSNVHLYSNNIYSAQNNNNTREQIERSGIEEKKRPILFYNIRNNNRDIKY